MKTSELTGPALDWAVLEALKPTLKDPSQAYIGTFGPLFGKGYRYPAWRSRKYSPSTSWQEGGPIIERERIDVTWHIDHWTAMWWADNSGMAKDQAQRFKHNRQHSGPTPLIAAMRCFVASRLGDEVDISDELLG